MIYSVPLLYELCVASLSKLHIFLMNAEVLHAVCHFGGEHSELDTAEITQGVKPCLVSIVNCDVYSAFVCVILCLPINNCFPLLMCLMPLTMT